MKLVAATVLVLSTYASASRAARRKQRLTNLYETASPCFQNSACSKPCNSVASLEDFLAFSGRRCKMCAAAKLKSCDSKNSKEQQEQPEQQQQSDESSSKYQNEPMSREKCISEKCDCELPLHDLGRSEKRACKQCARKSGCFRQKSRNQVLAELKKSSSEENRDENYTADDKVTKIDADEVSAILSFSSFPESNPLRILQQKPEATAENNDESRLRIPSGNPNGPLRITSEENEIPSSLSTSGQSIGRFTFSDKFKRNAWNPFQPEDDPKKVVDVQPDSEDYMDDLYTDGQDYSEIVRANGDYEFQADQDFINDDGESDYYQIHDEEDEDASYDDYEPENLDEDIYTDVAADANSDSLKSGNQQVDYDTAFNPFALVPQSAEVESWDNPANDAIHHESLVGDLPESMQSAVANMKQGDSYPTGLNYSKKNSEENKYDHKNTRRAQRKQLRQTTRTAKRLKCIASVADKCSNSCVQLEEEVSSWRVLKQYNKGTKNQKACMKCIYEVKQNC